MRFVDADALIETMHGHVTTMSVCSTTIEARAKGQMKQMCIADVANAPTIDAIPVEWLREKIKEHTDDEGWQDYLANSFGLCIEEWQKKQEAR